MIARTRVSLCFILLGLGLPGLAARVAPPVYKGAIVMDAATGEVLFSDHADEVSPPASMTKLMTFAVVCDRIRDGRLSLGTPVPITAADARVASQGDSTHVGLRAGETFSVEDLFYAIMIQSANDAAEALARSTAGSVPAFVELMNQKARSLGMTRTVFRSPNGFPPPSRRVADGDLTTPRDFAILSRYLVLHTDVTKYTSVKFRYFGSGVRFPPTPMSNHDHLLGKVEGLDGLKTGFTGSALFCLAATAQRHGRRLIAVVMGSPDARDRDLKVAQLLERCFALHPFHPTPPPATPTAGAAGGPAPLIRFTVP